MYAVEYPLVRASLAEAPRPPAEPSAAMARLAQAKARVPAAVAARGRAAWARSHARTRRIRTGSR